jgi:hypothetical protein
VQRYQAEPEEAVGLPTDTQDDEYQIHRHVVLLLVLSFSMFVVCLFSFPHFIEFFYYFQLSILLI